MHSIPTSPMPLTLIASQSQNMYIEAVVCHENYVYTRAVTLMNRCLSPQCPDTFRIGSLNFRTRSLCHNFREISISLISECTPMTSVIRILRLQFEPIAEPITCICHKSSAINDHLTSLLSLDCIISYLSYYECQSLAI